MSIGKEINIFAAQMIFAAVGVYVVFIEFDYGIRYRKIEGKSRNAFHSLPCFSKPFSLLF